MPSVLQDWVQDLPFMQQSVLISAIRGCDTLHKNHVSKKLQRWLRRCVLVSAFDGKVLKTPYEKGGGSFTGPSCKDNGSLTWYEEMGLVLRDYIRSLDEVPHHFQLHFLHAAEILGYKHPNHKNRAWWGEVYKVLCRDMHLNPETREQMDKRLADVEKQWREAEVVTAD